jgi:hypothetical protein
VPHHPSAFGLTVRYNDFLFAPIGEQANGMQLSVLSALARMNVDPWEEAARLVGPLGPTNHRIAFPEQGGSTHV